MTHAGTCREQESQMQGSEMLRATGIQKGPHHDVGKNDVAATWPALFRVSSIPPLDVGAVALGNWTNHTNALIREPRLCRKTQAQWPNPPYAQQSGVYASARSLKGKSHSPCQSSAPAFLLRNYVWGFPPSSNRPLRRRLRLIDVALHRRRVPSTC